MHEIWHFIPAWLFGCSPKLSYWYVIFDWDEKKPVEMIIILLTPLIACISFLIWLIYTWIKSASAFIWFDHFAMFVYIIVALGMIYGCKYDIQDIIEFLKTGNVNDRMEDKND